jgi:DnaJ-domain-containing protein 1
MVQAAFRAIVRDYHPDRFHSEPEDVRAQALERFRRAREAYERLAPE